VEVILVVVVLVKEIFHGIKELKDCAYPGIRDQKIL
jgi:hypothetical protein